MWNIDRKRVNIWHERILVFILLFIFCEPLPVWKSAHTCGNQRKAFRSWFFSSTLSTWVSNSGIENYVAKSFIRALFEHWTEVYGLSLFPHRWIILFWLWYTKTVETLWHLFIHLPTEFSKGGESKRHRIKNQTDNIAWYLIC